MKVFNDEDIRVERIWCGETTGTKLRVEHVPTGIVVERIIGFEDEKRHRRDLEAQLSHRLSHEYPAEHFIMERLWLGPGKGASLRLSHVPSGTSVERFIGFEPDGRYRREMVAELFRRLREFEIRHER